MLKKAIGEFLNLQPKKKNIRSKSVRTSKKTVLSDLNRYKRKTQVLTDLETKNYVSEQNKQQAKTNWIDIIPPEIRQNKVSAPKNEFISRTMRHLLFMNVGEEKIKQLFSHFKTGSERPIWSIYFDFEYIQPNIFLRDSKRE